ncbi:sensor histidine kinase [Microbacterium esteraromaticum]|nr:histidine kinase [Microbacterium esteraromaticum]
MRARTVWQALMLPPWRFLPSRWPWLALTYTATSAILTLILIPVLVFTIFFLPLWGIFVAAIERRRLRILGLPTPSSGHVYVPRDERRNWLNIRLMEPATWRETASLLTGLVLGSLAVIALFAQVMSIAVLIAIPVMAARSTTDITLFGDTKIVLGPETWWYPLLLVPVALFVFAYLNAMLSAAQGSCTRWLTAPRFAEMDQRVEQLTRSRATIVTAHENERQRIERDLHDGVQQELVGIAARLGILELELRGCTDEAKKHALRAAQDQTERALTSLRETVRGIHPAVLSDYGLPAALEELAGRSTVPLHIDDLGFPRLDPAAEAAGYFFITEALTNTAKHTTAPRLNVTLTTNDGHARIEARDDGHGGVDTSHGSGLRGLAERADTLDGELHISSPPGGPTILTLTLPAATHLSNPTTEVPGAYPSR